MCSNIRLDLDAITGFKASNNSHHFQIVPSDRCILEATLRKIKKRLGELSNDDLVILFFNLLLDDARRNYFSLMIFDRLLCVQ